jgi:prefoldin subunit 5
MKNTNTEALQYKSFYLNKMAEKAKHLSAMVEEVYDAKHWVDMCKDDLESTLEGDSDDGVDVDEVERSKARLARAERSLDEVAKQLHLLEAELRNFKDDIECLGTELTKFIKDQNSACFFEKTVHTVSLTTNHPQI